MHLQIKLQKSIQKYKHMNRELSFIIYSPMYSETNGGAIVLHKLCHLLNEIGHKAMIFPFFAPLQYETHNIPSFEYGETVKNLWQFNLNKSFNTPLLDITNMKNIELIRSSNDIVTIYPEIINGNPLGSKHVVRLLLNNPSALNPCFNYSSNELIYKYNSRINTDKLNNYFISELILHILHTPIEYYNLNECNQKRSGTAYCIRKGKEIPISHNLTDSICIDGLSHGEVSKIFKRVSTFFSYDPMTYYSQFAALSGCDSIIIKHANNDIFMNMNDLSLYYGVAYGESNLNFARETRNLLLNDIKRRESMNYEIVMNFVAEISKKIF